LLLPNLRNTPVLAVHGANDDDVPPTHGRLLTGMLDKMGCQAGYWEVPGQGHWWDASPDIPGTDCVDADRIMNFLQNNVRDPHPTHVTLVTYDLGNNDSSYWVKVLEEIKPLGRVEVDAEIIPGDKIKCTTHNVKRLSLDPFYAPMELLPDYLEIDGQVLKLQGKGWKTNFINADGHWRISDFTPEGMLKTFDFRGPIKRAYFKPFVIVVGTMGSYEEDALNLEIARNIAQRWWYRGNGYVRIIEDTAAAAWERTPNNLILIGGPNNNVVSKELSKFMPIQISDGGVWLNDKFIPGKDLAVQFIYPVHYYNNLAHCIWGTSLEGMRLAAGLTCMYSGSDLPDFLVYDKEVKLKGYAGVRAAGFFDNHWELDPDLYYIDK
jgi:hypothetical protein